MIKAWVKWTGLVVGVTVTIAAFVYASSRPVTPSPRPGTQQYQRVALVSGQPNAHFPLATAQQAQAAFGYGSQNVGNVKEGVLCLDGTCGTQNPLWRTSVAAKGVPPVSHTFVLAPPTYSGDGRWGGPVADYLVGSDF